MSPVNETGSPAWLAEYLSARRSRLEIVIAEILEKHASSFFLFSGAIMACIGLWLSALHFHLIQDHKFWIDGRYLVAFPIYTLCTLAGIWVSKSCGDRYTTEVVGFTQVVALGIAAYIFGATLFELGELAGLTLLFIVAGFTIYRFQEKMRWSSNAIFLLCFLIACALTNIQVAFIHHPDHQFLKIYTPFRWLLVLAIPLFAASVASGAVERRQLKNYLLFPMSFLYPLPSRLHLWERRPDARRTSRGLIDVTIGLLFLLILVMQVSPSFQVSSGKGLGGFLLNGFINYFYTYFRSAAIITLPVGLGRILGFHLSDPYEFPLLATTPQERWRRWNTYFYHFFIVSTFHPVYKYTRSILLAVACVFFLTAVTHESVSRLFAFTPQNLGPANFAHETLAFFFLHGLFVYIGIKTERFWPTMRTRKGWFGVLLTTFLMSLIHFYKLRG